MEKITLNKFKNNKNQICWLADDLSGALIIRSKNWMGWLYEIAETTAYGNRVVASFNTLSEAKTYLAKERS